MNCQMVRSWAVEFGGMPSKLSHLQVESVSCCSGSSQPRGVGQSESESESARSAHSAVSLCACAVHRAKLPFCRGSALWLVGC